MLFLLLYEGFLQKELIVWMRKGKPAENKASAGFLI